MAIATVTAAGMQIIKLLVGHSSRTITELIAETGANRPAIMARLNSLVVAGFVERTIERLPGRGRPRYRYSPTRAALVLMYAFNRLVAVPFVWQAIDELGGKPMTEKVQRVVSRQLAEHYTREDRGHRSEGASPAVPLNPRRRGRAVRSGCQGRPTDADQADLRSRQHLGQSAVCPCNRPEDAGRDHRLCLVAELVPERW